VGDGLVSFLDYEYEHEQWKICLMSESGRSLSKYTAIFAGGTMISRVTGLLRDIVTAALIPREAWAAFNVAFRFPNMLRDLVGDRKSVV
jgi:peptidoglycan biosynthesis protein MviN/MurJ (putative lipid II flippase)